MFKDIKVELCSHWGGDRDAANAAWASSTDQEKLESKTPADVMRVVTGVVHHHHDTPKERLWFEFFMTMPIFSERQFDKYRMTIQYQQFTVEWMEAPMGRDHITQNELSGRYRTIPDRPFGMPKDVSLILGRVVLKGLENEELPRVPTVEELAEEQRQIWEYRLKKQHESYQNALTQLKEAERAGVITNAEYKRVREVLRGELGTAFLTDMRIVMNVNAFEHIVNQRIAKDTQLDSRVVGYKMVKAVQDAGIQPVMIAEMIKANNWQSLLDEIEAKIKADEE